MAECKFAAATIAANAVMLAVLGQPVDSTFEMLLPPSTQYDFETACLSIQVKRLGDICCKGTGQEESSEQA